MYFDDYSTSFQSLYKPMYNMTTNYSAIGNPAMGGAAGAGVQGYPGGWMMNPLANVGVGQFGPDQLLQNNEQRANYHVRPIATHKKKDELPKILGIVGATLGTAALLIALCKGKKLPSGAGAATGAATTGAATGAAATGAAATGAATTGAAATGAAATGAAGAGAAGAGAVATGAAGTGASAIAPDVSKFGSQPYVASTPTYLNPNTPAYNRVSGLTNPNNISNALANPVSVPKPATQLSAAEIATKKGVMTPEAQKAYRFVSNNQFSAGAAREARRADARAAFSAANYTAEGKMTPQAQEAYERVLSQQFKPNWNASAQPLKKSVRNQMKADARAAFSNIDNVGGFPAVVNQQPVRTTNKALLNWRNAAANAEDAIIVSEGSLPALVQKPQLKPVTEYIKPSVQQFDIPSSVKGLLPAPKATSNGWLGPVDQGALAKVRANNATIRPDMTRNGSIMYTTHTQPTFSEGYSIGANAKGADKLAALLQQMQG